MTPYDWDRALNAIEAAIKAACVWEMRFCTPDTLPDLWLKIMNDKIDNSPIELIQPYNTNPENWP